VTRKEAQIQSGEEKDSFGECEAHLRRRQSDPDEEEAATTKVVTSGGIDIPEGDGELRVKETWTITCLVFFLLL
jgi:hypothetical protein